MFNVSNKTLLYLFIIIMLSDFHLKVRPIFWKM